MSEGFRIRVTRRSFIGTMALASSGGAVAASSSDVQERSIDFHVHLFGKGDGGTGCHPPHPFGLSSTTTATSKVPLERIANRIYFIRGQKVMLDGWMACGTVNYSESDRLESPSLDYL